MMNRQELLKNAKPILFNTGMVKAILDGKKSCTRRVIKYSSNINPSATLSDFAKTANDWECIKGCCQYQVGDVLWVRETWGEKPAEIGGGYIYKADIEQPHIYKWCPSIHMPKSAARIFLRVTDVRVEQLQDITEEQCYCEGVEREAGKVGFNFAKGIFRGIWNSTIKKADIDRYRWEANPWMYVIKFERMTIDG